MAQKIQSIQDKRKIQKESLAAREEMRKIREEIEWKEERFTQLRKRKQNFRDCRLEKKEEVAMHRKRWNAFWKRWWNRLSLWERVQGMCTLKSVFFEMFSCCVFFGP